MWTKIQFISNNCYPNFDIIDKNKVLTPPIIEFRIGNIYKSKISFIESLSYTIPDDSNWETIDGLQLPKIVEIALSIKFIESAGAEDTLYSYEITKESLKIINEKRGAGGETDTQFSEESKTNGGENKPQVVPLDSSGVEMTEEREKQKDNSGINKAPKDIKTGKPSVEETSIPIPENQKLFEEAEKSPRFKRDLTTEQKPIVQGLLVDGYEEYKGKKLKSIRESQNDIGMVIYFKDDGLDNTIYMISRKGNVTGPIYSFSMLSDD